MAKEHVKAALLEARDALDALIAADETQEAIVQASQRMIEAIRSGKKILSCGNGGSLCDAMHFAEEMTGRFRSNRPGYAAIAISDASHMSCVGNDYGKCNACNTGLCPVGITTQNRTLVDRLDVDKVAENIVNYFIATNTELKKLLAPIGNSSLPVGRSDALVTVDKNVATRLEIQHVC